MYDNILTAKEEITKIVDTLRDEQVTEVLRILKRFAKPEKASSSQPAPIFELHRYAVDTGVSDLAERHDHYLYGVTENNE